MIKFGNLKLKYKDYTIWLKYRMKWKYLLYLCLDILQNYWWDKWGVGGPPTW